MQELSIEKIISDQMTYPIAIFRQMIDDSYLIIEQSFHWEYFYDNIKASGVVESALLGFPRGNIYLSDDNGGF